MEPLLKILLELVAKQQGISEAEVAELLFDKNSEDKTKLDYSKLKPDALTNLLGQDEARVAKLKAEKTDTDKTEIYNKAFADAKKEILPKVEKQIAEKYGITYDPRTTKIESLVEAVVSNAVSTAAVPADKITEDIVKKHPTYVSRESELNAAIEAAREEGKTELAKIQATYKKEQTFGSVKENIIKHFNDLNPILSSKAAKQTDDFVKQFAGYDYEPIEGSKDFLILQDGKRLEDKHGNPVTLKNFVTEKASESFDFKKQEDVSSPGNKGAAGAAVKVPTSKDEYNLAMLEANTLEDRKTLTDAYVAAGGTVD